MDARARDELERQIRLRWEARDYNGAAETAIRGYGPEIFGFLVAFHHDEEDAAEVFSRVTERLWSGLERFSWQSSFRTWLYVVARNTSLRYRREAQQRARRMVPLPDGSALSAIAAQVRSETMSALRSQKKDWVAAMRDALPEEDRMLLVLRVDKGLAWTDLARVMHEDGEKEMDDEEVRREAARLRKRFQLVKERLLAARRGSDETNDGKGGSGG